MNAQNFREDDDAAGTPWIVKKVARNPGNLLTTSDIANAVTTPGRDKMKTLHLVRHHLKVGHLHPVARETEGRERFLFLPDQILAAEILLRMGDFGISDAAAANAAWRAITVWKGGDFEGKRPAATPGMHVIFEYEAGVRDWSFELWMFRHETYDQKRYTARIAANLRREGTALDVFKRDGFHAQSVFAVDLIDFLDQRWSLFFPWMLN